MNVRYNQQMNSQQEPQNYNSYNQNNSSNFVMPNIYVPPPGFSARQNVNSNYNGQRVNQVQNLNS